MRVITNKTKMCLVFLFVFLFSLSRIPRLNNDIVSSDAVLWHDRAQKFMNAIIDSNYEDTYQKYHPGVTLMWITGLTARYVSNARNVEIANVYTNYEQQHYYAKLTLVLWQLFLSLVAISLLTKIFGFAKSLAGVSLFTFEPFFVGNSRLLHLDAQIALYLIIGLTASYICAKKYSLWYGTMSGVFFGLAALSKTIAIGGLVFSLLFGGYVALTSGRLTGLVRFFFTALSVFVLTYFVLFPSLWVDTIGTLDRLYSESKNVGSELGHKQLFFGEYTRNPGVFFYPVLLLMKTSLFTVIGAILFLYKKLLHLIKEKEYISRLKNPSFVLFMSIFYIGYFVVITYFSKKVDRYPIPLYPFIGIVGALGYFELKIKRKFVLATFILLTIVFPLVTAFPHYMTYVSPVVGNTKIANNIIGQKLFGIGVFDLKKEIEENYRPYVKVAINDYETLAAIYGKERTFDVFSEHPNSYDLLVLGVNKDFPPSVVNSGIRFKHSRSVYINGLEFWRIYTKTTRL